MITSKLKTYILAGGLDDEISADLALDVETTKAKYISAIESFEALYGEDRDVHIYSVGGRTEVSGNHTDHNLGKVLAAAVNLELLCIASPREDGVVRIKSEGFPEDEVTPDAISAPDESKYFTSAAIIAGMERAFVNGGYTVGGFDAYTTSAVLKGSGLSSSAAFEVMVGNVLNHMYNGGSVDNAKIAIMAQYAENVYFGKPCGLMDQTACAVGGFISIDFKDAEAPVINKINFDLNSIGYSLCIVNTGGNHADLNEDYASVPAEMKAVAALLGGKVLREFTEKDLTENAVKIREAVGDRALMRAYHFISENERVDAIAAALESWNFEGFLSGITESGNSSFKYLQNVYTTKNVAEQGISLALCLTERYLRQHEEFYGPAACRVHGGGFAGTIQVFLPKTLADDYKKYIEGVFGEGSCHLLSVRRAGAVCLK